MKKFKSFFFSYHLGNRFFIAIGISVSLLVIAYFLPILQFPAILSMVIVFIELILESIMLYSGNSTEALRKLGDKLSNGDENPVQINLENKYPFPVHFQVIDELPYQFQKRDFNLNTHLKSGEKHSFHYFLRPVQRGVYQFGKLRVFASTLFRLVSRRYSFGEALEVAVYPSFLSMQKYEFLAFNNHLQEIGIKKVRKLGHNYEFEKIKDYVPGDDFRTINWKATARRSKLMVNLYEDERSQQVYSVIDKGRVMKNPSLGLTLLDYAINSSLVLSNIAIKKYDKAGLISFDHKEIRFLPADRRAGQMYKIQEQLYRENTAFLESDFERLYVELRRKISQRSLLILYTNFDTVNSMQRHLPYLKAIASRHLLLLVFFQNTEVDSLLASEARSTEQVYLKTIAEKFQYEKQLIVDELAKHGIMSILSTPQQLSIKTLNKYLEIKARGIL